MVVAIAKSAVLSRWIGAVGIAVGAVSIAPGVVTAYIGFSEPVSDIWAVTLYRLDNNPWYFHVEKDKGEENDQ